jgi:O-antigen/teichoic acid export membrane protein
MRMSSQGSTTTVGIIAGLVSFVVLGFLEVPLIGVLFGGEPSNGFGFPFVLLGAGMILIPANMVAATLIGKRVYKEQRRKANA